MVQPLQNCSFFVESFCHNFKTNKVKYIKKRKVSIFSKGISREIYSHRLFLAKKNRIFEKFWQNFHQNTYYNRIIYVFES